MDKNIEEFKTAFGNLTPEEQTTYANANPTVSVGGQTLQASNGYEPLTSQALTNEPKMTLSQSPIETESAGLSGLTSAIVDSSKEEFARQEALRKEQAEIAKSQSALDAQRKVVTDYMGQTGTQTEIEDRVSQEVGLDAAEADLRDINQRILESQRAQDKEVRAALEATGGLKEGAQDAVSAINRKYAFEQADLAIVQMAKQGKFNSAERIAARKVNAQLERDKLNLQTLLFDYNENKEMFTKKEQRLFEAKTKEEDRRIQKEEESLKSFESTKREMLKSAISQGAPSDILVAIQSAKTSEEAIKAAGIYSVDQLDRDYKRAQTNKLNAETGKMIGEMGAASQVSPYQDERMSRTLQSVQELTQKALQNPGIFGRTAAMPIPKWLRTGAFRDFSAELDTLKSSIAFGELTAMREASKTGGALGQVSDREGKLLESALGALSMSQTPENFVNQLTKINASITRWRNAVNQYGSGQGTAQTTVVAPTGEEIIITD